MFKRTKGYILLTMLVLTGLAGRMHSNILTTKERHTLVTELKSSRNDFLKNIDGLSARQMRFKARKKELSIQDCIFKLVETEHSLWTTAQASLKQETPSGNKTFTDEVLPSVIQLQPIWSNGTKFSSIKEALKFYKNEKAEMLKYVHTSTDNVRGHIARTNMGNFDSYQLMLLSTIYCKHYTQQIEQIKAHPRFPK
jgi:hypothetical protein